MIDRSESTDLWAEVVAAVEYLREGHRPGLAVWDALTEGIAAWVSDYSPAGGNGYSQAWSDADPLRTTLEALLRMCAAPELPGGHSIADVCGAALRLWLDQAREHFNDGRCFIPEMHRRLGHEHSAGIVAVPL